MERVLGIYCERGFDPSFWAEPVNAVTNGAFLIAGALLLSRARADGRAVSIALAALIILIGVGSFLFHTLAMRWTGLADVLPIAAFIFVAVYALARRALGLGTGLSLGALAAFVGFVFLIFAAGRAYAPWLGSTLGYAPAFLVLLGAGLALTAARREGGVMMLGAGAVFAVSLSMRLADRPLCSETVILGQTIGTHFLWHLLNALTLYLVARALIGMRTPSTARRRPA